MQSLFSSFAIKNFFIIKEKHAYLAPLNKRAKFSEIRITLA